MNDKNLSYADRFYELERKYRAAPRKGRSVAGSRAKANQTIEVNRAEIVEAMAEACLMANEKETELQNTIFYEKVLCALADGEDDAMECDKCTGVYRIGWFDGKCPYCEVDHDAVIVTANRPEQQEEGYE